MSDVYAKVLDPTYSIRGKKIPKGRIVHVTSEQLAAAKSSDPPTLERVNKPEAGVPITDIRPSSSLVTSQLASPAAVESGTKK